MPGSLRAHGPVIGLTPQQQAARVRAHLDSRMYPTVALEDELLLLVIERTGDIEIAAEAIAQYPRPRWVYELLGDHHVDVGVVEMLHRGDRADRPEWGPAGTG